MSSTLTLAGRAARRLLRAAPLGVGLILAVSACSTTAATTPSSTNSGGSTVITVVAEPDKSFDAVNVTL